MKGATKQIIGWIKKESVLVIAIVLAVVSMFLIPPDRQYIDYIDYKTIGLLFCLMSVMAGYQKIGIFQWMGETLLTKVKMSRSVAAVLVFLCFFTSMFITNDVSLLTFVPFSIIVLEMAELEELLVPVVVLQTIAANLGSMILPFGNPQNLYLYGQSGYGILQFVAVILPFGIIAFVLLTISLFGIKKVPVTLHIQQHNTSEIKSNRGKIIAYTVLFVLCILAVAHILPWTIALIIVSVVIFLLDKELFCRVDYSLLFTFVFFFLFIGNLGRIPSFCEFLEGILKGNEVITAVLASQIISNVPAALLLSGFSNQWDALIIGTNLGGLGTLIASMASLISYKQVAQKKPEYKSKYFRLFTIANVGYLIVLMVAWLLFEFIL
jgi:Na+/H+ antiporter NhaD/arsenite permease-like protein